MPLYPSASSIRLQISMVFLSLCGGCNAQYFTTTGAPMIGSLPTSTFTIIIIVGGLAVFAGIPLIIKAFCLKDSPYRCECLDNTVQDNEAAILANQNVSELRPAQIQMFQDRGQHVLAKPREADTVDRSGWHTPPEKVGKVVEDLHIEMAIAAIEKPKEHILISYDPSSKEDVMSFTRRLKQERYRVWIEEEQAFRHRGSEMEGKLEAMKGAAVFVPVLTERYEHSTQCRKEAEYADRQGKKIVPVRMQPKYRPDGWLAFLLGNTLFHDLSNDETYQVQMDNFLEAIESLGVNAKMDDDEYE